MRRKIHLVHKWINIEIYYLLFTNFQVCNVYPLAINVVIVNVLASSSDSLKITLSGSKYFLKCNRGKYFSISTLKVSKQLKDMRLISHFKFKVEIELGFEFYYLVSIILAIIMGIYSLTIIILQTKWGLREYSDEFSHLELSFTLWPSTILVPA